MNKFLRKTTLFLLILALLLCAVGCTTHPEYATDYPEYVAEPSRTRAVDPDDVFDVYFFPGEEYNGFIFLLKEGATFLPGEHPNVRAISPRVWYAPTLDDIRAAVDPEHIEWIEPNWIFSLGPPLNSHPQSQHEHIIFIAGGVFLVAALLFAYILYKSKKHKGEFTNE